MKIIFIHQNMPGQFKYLARKLAENPANEVYFITKRENIEIPGVRKILYRPSREPTPSTHHYLISAERGVLHGQQVARALLSLKEQGFRPDVIYAHPGWGEALYVKDVYPNVPLLGFFEFYYRSRGSDVGFNPEETVSLDDMCRIRTKNIINTMSLEACDAGVSPTYWQYSQHPAEYLYKMSVVFDGIDTQVCKPDGDANFTLPNGQVLTRQDEVVTYVARNFEPYRGFQWYMKALEILCRERPNAHFIMVGADDVSYGKRPSAGTTYRQEMLKQVNIDPARVHFVGNLPYDKYLKVLQISSTHVYLTYPFVLSWSMVESMSTGCLIVASRTQPVMEVLEDGVNGLLVDFFNPEEIAARVIEALEKQEEYAVLRQRARQTVLERYELQACLDQQITLLNNLAAGFRPAVPSIQHQHGRPSLVRPQRQREIVGAIPLKAERRPKR